ncbi:MAG: CDP-alcohol phosphatidyltransferase family protein [Nanoarchaeota archaeon]
MKNIEPIKELRVICQPRYEQVKTNRFYRIYRRFFRIFSIYFTKILLYFNVSANIISISALIFGIIGSLYFYYGKFLIGSLIMQLWFLADTLDGELARYYYKKNKKKNYLVKGEFLDLNSHHLIHSLMFIGLSLGLYNLYNNIGMIYFGISSLFALLLNELIDLNKIKVLFYESINKKIKIKLNKTKNNKSLLRRGMMIYTFPTIINIFLMGSLFNKIEYILYFYGITFPLIVLTKFIINNFIRKW